MRSTHDYYYLHLVYMHSVHVSLTLALYMHYMHVFHYLLAARRRHYMLLTHCTLYLVTSVFVLK